jgi:hypothetical protein
VLPIAISSPSKMPAITHLPVDTARERDWRYVALVTDVYVNRDRPGRFGFKALIGGGEATVGQQFTHVQPQRGGPGAPVTVTDFYHAGMFVFEPEADGRRESEPAHEADGRRGPSPHRRSVLRDSGFYGYGNSRINGVTGSVGLQIGGGL